MGNIEMSVCPDCSVEVYQVAGTDEWECMCGKPTKELYQNRCWFCKTTINEVNSKWSKTFNMGLICHNCGHDLSGWKRKIK